MHCTGGGDCDDADPTVSSLTAEVCANAKDDDCDTAVDEADCAAPTNDTCLDPLDISQPGTYAMSTAAAALDYAASCGVENTASARDVIAALALAAGPPRDVQLTVRADTGDVALALLGQCAQPATEIACSGGGFKHPDGGTVAKVRGRSVGDAVNPLALPVYVQSDSNVNVTLRYDLLPASNMLSKWISRPAARAKPASRPATA